jgi:hypothetical protein
MLRIDPIVIRGLRALLDELGYDAVQRTLRPDYYTAPFPPFEPFRLLIGGLPEPLRIAYEVLLLGQPLGHHRLEEVWGRDFVRRLLEIGFLELDRAGRARTANYCVVSFMGRYFVVSMNPMYPGSRDPDASVYIGGDSYTLAANLLAPFPGDTALDLCAGSGIQAILLADRLERVTAVELNEEAARVLSFNAVLNEVEDRVDVRDGSL